MKIKIRQTGENFESDMWEFIRNYSNEVAIMLRRDEFINEIFSLEENVSGEDKFQRLGSISIDNTRYGSTYQGSGTRNDISQYYASHVITEISFEDGEFWAGIKILNTAIGRPLQNLKKDELELELVPIYNSEEKIITFDIDLNVKFISGTESYHYSLKK
jgi:hypothetical protein